MDRQEAIQTLSKVGKISVSYAEDLYDSFFTKPAVSQCVADWYEEHKGNLNSEIYYLIRYWEAKERTSDFYKWFDDTKNEAIKTLVNMHQFGYEVESEKEYVIELKNSPQILLYEEKNEEYYFAEHCGIFSRESHTRKELEEAGFEWVFDCEGVEVKKVDDGND
ncbi:DUF1642 domain-containing protein [Streptococcus salivarius]|uniref:DUF1642 domain-containing protein n=1 Tax=Streptococcus salivarius TaxID=1304 RepID=UPI0039C41BC3